MLPVVLDTCVLLPITLADTILHIADTQLIDVRWSEAILDELDRVLVRRGLTAGAAQRRVQAMRRAFPHALIEDYEPLIASMTNDPGDRHVLAATVASDAKTLVTFNLRHFPASSLGPHDVVAVHPDDWLVDQLDTNATAVLAALETQSAGYEAPPRTTFEILDRLRRCGVPTFADEARRHLT
jgi:predicted nucleic acid-binding protein